MTKKLILTIFHCLFSYVAVAGLIVYEFTTPDNKVAYKLSLAGIVLLVFIVIIAKRQFVKHYQNKTNDLLEGLAMATEQEDKVKWKKKLHKHKLVMAIVESIDTLLPMVVLAFATSWAGSWLTYMSGIIGICCVSMLIGEGFRVWKRVGGAK